MARTRGSTANLGLTGIPLQIFLEFLKYGSGEQSHLEKMVTLEKVYSWLRAYLPVLYEGKEDEYEKKGYAEMMKDASTEIAAMNTAYDPIFEGIQTCNVNEKKFCLIMRGVHERLAFITAKARIIDKIQAQPGEEMIF